MFDTFKEYGLVVEVYIPARRDKRGKRFRFVRFRKVVYKNMLAIKLDNILIQGRNDKN